MSVLDQVISDALDEIGSDNTDIASEAGEDQLPLYQMPIETHIPIRKGSLKLLKSHLHQIVKVLRRKLVRIILHINF